MIKTKICTKCKKRKPLTEFHFRSITKRTKHAQCIPCRASHGKEIYRSDPRVRVLLRLRNKEYLKNTKIRLREYVSRYLLSHPCSDCGITDIRVLDFDHRDEMTKEYQISTLMNGNYGYDLVIREIDKCEVRCANCHRIKNSEKYGYWKSKIV